MRPGRIRLVGAAAVIFAVAVVAAALPAVLDSEVAPAGAPRPNIVVIMTDDQTAAMLHHMDAVERLLGEKGVTFTNSYASFPLCCPSRATYLTGQHAHNHGVLDNSGPRGGYKSFDGQDQTLASALDAAGYETGFVGKYLNGYGRKKPKEIPPGWDDWFGLVGASAYRYWGYSINANGAIRTGGLADRDYQTDALRRIAVRQIRADASSTEPFFLTIMPLAPHVGENDRYPGDERVWPAPRHQGAYAEEPLPRGPAFDEKVISDKPQFLRTAARLTAFDEEHLQTVYQGALESLLAVDELVGDVVSELREAGALDDTVIVFTSDNGFFYGEHRQRSGKRYHYEPASRVPLVIRGPGVAEGVAVDALVSNVDLAPTLVALAGAEPPREFDGRSLVPLLTDADAPWIEGDVLLENGPPGGATTYRALRTPQYKYVEWSSGERELYDLVDDPHELVNRADSVDLAAVQAELAERLATRSTCAGATCRP